MFLFIIGVLGFIGSIVLLILSFVRKKPKKTALIVLFVSVILMFTGLLMDNGDDTPEVADEPKEEVEENQEIEDEEDTEEVEEPVEEEPEVEEETESSEPEVAELDRKVAIKSAIKSRINDGDYKNTDMDRITINDNMGDAEGETYIALVYLEFDIKNRRKTANEMMRMYSDDLAATLANKGIEDIAEIAIFWEDHYNNRDVKYAYEYEDGEFYIMDIAGE